MVVWRKSRKVTNRVTFYVKIVPFSRELRTAKGRLNILTFRFNGVGGGGGLPYEVVSV
jgi:hypothetical protein